MWPCLPSPPGWIGRAGCLAAIRCGPDGIAAGDRRIWRPGPALSAPRGDGALDDPRWSGRVNDRALTRATDIARAAREQHVEGGRDDVETLGHVLTDLAERAATAGAGLILEVGDLFDPFQVSRSRAAVGFRGSACLVHGVLSLSQGRLNLP